MLLGLLGLEGSGDIWICCLLFRKVLVKFVGYIALFLVLYGLGSKRRFGVFWLPCKVALGCMFVWITLMLLIIWLVLLLVGGLVALFSLVKDGDLLRLAQRLVNWRGPGNSAVTKVKGHADEGLVFWGRVREVDRLGDNLADAAADLGRRRVHHCVFGC